MPSPDLIDRELEQLVRETKPEVDPLWATAMDAKVARGFTAPAPESRGRRSWRPSLMPAMGAAASVLLVVVLAVSVSGRSGEAEVGQVGDGGGGGAVGATADDIAAEEPAVQESAGGMSAPRASAQSAPVPPDDSALQFNRDARGPRKIEQSALLTLAAKPGDIDETGAAIMDTARRFGGYVASSSVTSSRRDGGGQFDLRIPASRLDAALDALRKLGRVRELTRAQQDITGSYNSAAARLRELRAARAGLLRQLAKAATPNETDSIRRRLRIVRGQISAASDQLAQVNRRAQYSTVNVSLVASRSTARENDDTEGWTPGDAWTDAKRILEVSAGVALVAAAVALPLGLVALAGWLAGRSVTRRRRERALDAAA